MKKGLLKKFTAALCVTAMAVSMLAACGNSGGSSTNSTKAAETKGAAGAADTQANQTEAKSNEEAYEIVMAYVTVGTDPTDMKKVEAKLSELTMDKINCTVKFKPVAIADLASQYNLWASSGERVDLLMMFNMNIGTYINEGKIISLEDYKDNAPKIMELSKESPFLAGGYYNNQLYAIPVINPSTGQGKAMYARTDLLEAAGLEKKDLYSYEDLDKIFAALHEQNPDMITIGWSGLRTTTFGTHFIACDTLGVPEAYAGVIMDIKSDAPKVENFFASEEYYQFLEQMQKWQQAGYFSKDASTTSDNAMDWVKAGRCAGFTIGDDTPGNIENQEATTGFDITQLNIKPTFVTTETYNQLRWCVSTSSERPDKAVAFLNMLYDGEDAVNMIMNGIEGEHYTKNEGSKIISYPEGINDTNTPYSYVLGIYGDKRNLYMFEPNEDAFYTRSEEYTAAAVKNPSIALGYSFNSEANANEIAAITSVLSKYMTSLEYGMVDNLKETYDEFIKELNDAGIDKVIEENQKQLDEWLAAQK